MTRNVESQDRFETYFPHGWPSRQWEDLKKRSIPLSIRMPFDGWTEITEGKVPDLTLAQYVAARHIVVSQPVPGRVKDAVVMNTPRWIRDDLNRWNWDTAHLRHSYGFGDIRMVEPMIAIAGSASHAYVPFERHSPELERLALVVFDMGCDLGLIRHTEELVHPRLFHTDHTSALIT